MLHERQQPIQVRALIELLPIDLDPEIRLRDAIPEQHQSLCLVILPGSPQQTVRWLRIGLKRALPAASDRNCEGL